MSTWTSQRVSVVCAGHCSSCIQCCSKYSLELLVVHSAICRGVLPTSLVSVTGLRGSLRGQHFLQRDCADTVSQSSQETPPIRFVPRHCSTVTISSNAGAWRAPRSKMYDPIASGSNPRVHTLALICTGVRQHRQVGGNEKQYRIGTLGTSSPPVTVVWQGLPRWRPDVLPQIQSAYTHILDAIRSAALRHPLPSALSVIHSSASDRCVLHSPVGAQFCSMHWHQLPTEWLSSAPASMSCCSRRTAVGTISISCLHLQPTGHPTDLAHDRAYHIHLSEYQCPSVTYMWHHTEFHRLCTSSATNGASLVHTS